MLTDSNATQAVAILAQGIPPIASSLVKPNQHSWIVDGDVCHEASYKGVRTLGNNTSHYLTSTTHVMQSPRNCCLANMDPKHIHKLCLNLMQVYTTMLEYQME